MNKDTNKGAITIYLSIILSAVILLSGILMDIVRIRAAEVQVRRAVNTAALSTLAGYNTKLKEDYGLFALQNSGSQEVEETIRGYLEKNLLTDMKDLDKKHQAYQFLKGIVMNDQYKHVNFVDLYDYRVEDIEVTPLFNFTENEVARQQITEYMKYRAPSQFAEDFLAKVDYAAGTKKQTVAYKQKTAIDKKLGKLEKSLLKLQGSIDQLNTFKKSDFDCAMNSNSLLMQFCESYIQYQAYGICRYANLGSASTPEEAMQIAQMRERLEMAYRNALGAFERAQADLNERLNERLRAAQEALVELNNIERLARSARSDIENLKNSLQELKSQKDSEGAQNADVIKALEHDVARYERLLDEDNSKSITAKLNNDYEILSQLQMQFSSLPVLIQSEVQELMQTIRMLIEDSPQQAVGISINSMPEYVSLMTRLASNDKLRGMKEAADRFEKLPNVVSKGKSGKGQDPRKKTADTARKIRKELSGDASELKTIANPELLPSYRINGNYPNKVFSEGILAEQEDEAVPKVVEDFDVDFQEDSEFVEGGLEFVMNFAAKLEEMMLHFRDEIYVNEYIIKVFRDSVQVKDSDTDVKINTSFFQKGEVEYILCGSPKEDVNRYFVKGQILLIRFGMNTLHVYSDPEKRMQALEVATAAAGITGFGIPIVHNLIMCAWGTAEAFYDLQDIYDGKKVPFIKNAANWKTDLLPSGFKTKEGVQPSDGAMDFDYHDYLRLLLLVQNKDTKMNRVEDLIQLNLQQASPEFKLSSSSTYLKTNVQVSIRYWFITKLFVPSRFKTQDGNRHLINVEVWRGY